MSIKHIRRLVALSALLISRSTWGQNAEADLIRGELVVNSSPLVHAEVILSDLQDGRSIATSPVSTDNQFEFRHIPYGQYRLTVLDADNRPIHDELISVRQAQQPIQVQVTQRDQPRPASGKVSARELLHPPSKTAVKAFAAAQKFSEAGKHGMAAEELAKAVQLSPDYAKAWTNLGVEHVYLKRYEEGLQELVHAGEISGPTAMILCDMSYAQFGLHRYAEGTRSAREAVRLDPSSAPAHYLLGLFLVREPGTRAEGVQHLETAARTMPAARADLDRVRRETAQVANRP